MDLSRTVNFRDADPQQRRAWAPAEVRIAPGAAATLGFAWGSVSAFARYAQRVDGRGDFGSVGQDGVVFGGSAEGDLAGIGVPLGLLVHGRYAAASTRGDGGALLYWGIASFRLGVAVRAFYDDGFAASWPDMEWNLSVAWRGGG